MAVMGTLYHHQAGGRKDITSSRKKEARESGGWERESERLKGEVTEGEGVLGNKLETEFRRMSYFSYLRTPPLPARNTNPW